MREIETFLISLNDQFNHGLAVSSCKSFNTNTWTFWLKTKRSLIEMPEGKLNYYVRSPKTKTLTSDPGLNAA